MLVLSRKSGESICVGHDIVIKVIKVSGSTVRLAFDAPAEVTIHRGEIEARIQQEIAACEAARAPIDMVSP
jgi:carbon storage regulator